MICSIDDCEKEVLARSWCSTHYKRWWYKGDPMKLLVATNGTRKYHSLYSLYCNMKARCNSPKNTFYQDYGGRGIKVCKRWDGIEGFDNFVKDMGSRPLGMTLDRVNNNEGYSPKNCRWRSKTLQAINRRKRVTNKSGYTGVFQRSINSWNVTITTNKKRINVGSFRDIGAAIDARKKAEQKYFKPLLEVT